MLKKNSKKSAINLAKEIARIICDKKGEDIVIFDLREISPITDFFVIATGLSEIHNKTLAEYLMEYEKPDHIEGLEGGGWILLDYIDVIVHLFLKEAREFYGLERLWGDAPQIKI
jgi:ribosome-associated protein|uniref:Ribosomal silencing factor RsfS n=1 Tax=candidate division WOR-3 bacterium TaxID=2052148 RepID=A0A7V3RGH1_UNCW3